VPDLDIPIVLQTEWEKKWADNTHFYNNIFYADGTARFTLRYFFCAKVDRCSILVQNGNFFVKKCAKIPLTDTAFCCNIV